MKLPVPSRRRPLYTRLLHLRHIAPNAWQRQVLGEGSFGLAVVLVLADLATAWTLLALPLAVAALVKAHDLLAGLLGRPPVPLPGQEGAGGPPERPSTRSSGRANDPGRTNGAVPRGSGAAGDRTG